MDITLSDEWLLWGTLLIVGFPLLMLALSEVILRLDRRDRPMVKVIRELRNWVFPLSGLFFLLTKVLDIDSDRLPIQLVETLAWVALIAAALSFANVVLFIDAKPNSWQANLPKLFRDLIRTVLILVGGALVLSTVFNQDLGGLIATLGIGGIVIGLALQDTLGNLFSGVALLFERPFELGDWLEVDGEEGKVIEVNWRSVHLITREMEQLVVPNSALAGAVIRNYNKPTPRCILIVDIGFSYDDPPNKVKRVMLEAALDTKDVLRNPAPIIVTVSYDDFSIAYKVRLFIEDYSLAPTIRNEFVTRIWYAARRSGLAIPFPIRDVFHHQVPKVAQDETFRRLANYMKSLPSLAMVEDEVLEEIAPQATLAHFGRGESVVVQGEMDVKMHFILAGEAAIFTLSPEGRRQRITELGRGEFFGYAALLANEPSRVNIVASEDLEVLVLETDAVQNMLDKNPRFAQQISGVVADRQSKIKELQPKRDSSRASSLLSQAVSNSTADYTPSGDRSR